MRKRGMTHYLWKILGSSLLRNYLGSFDFTSTSPHPFNLGQKQYPSSHLQLTFIPALLSPPPPGTFSTRSPFSSLISFIRDSLVVDWLPFSVIAASAGGRLSEEDNNDKTLAELTLVPSSVVNVTFDDELLTQCRQSIGTDFYFVKDELLQRIERL